MRRPKHRPERVGEMIRQSVAEFLTGKARDPRIGFVTVTAVEVSGDLAHARVRVSVMGSDEEKAKSLEGLASAARFLRARIARELPLRTAPELRVELGRGAQRQLPGDAGAQEAPGAGEALEALRLLLVRAHHAHAHAGVRQVARDLDGGGRDG